MRRHLSHPHHMWEARDTLQALHPVPDGAGPIRTAAYVVL